MNKFVMMYCNIWTTRPVGECWKALHQPEVICTRASVKYTPCSPPKKYQRHGSMVWYGNNLFDITKIHNTLL